MKGKYYLIYKTFSRNLQKTMYIYNYKVYNYKCIPKGYKCRKYITKIKRYYKWPFAEKNQKIKNRK